MNTYKMFLLETLTHMHVGSGDTHFGIVDNLIQRNPVTRVPNIHASGIKGALREFFEDVPSINPHLPYLFGGPVNVEKADQNGVLDFSPGHLIFLEANLLTLPLRANQNVYYSCASIPVLEDYLNALKFFGNTPETELELVRKFIGTISFGESEFVYFKGENGLEIEDFSVCKKYASDIPTEIKSFFQKYFKLSLENIALFRADIFAEICETCIPVLARNQINDDGTSGNLFYEEVLPKKSVLYFTIGFDKYFSDNKNIENLFMQEFINPKHIYQFGGNFSIGYGFSKVHEIGKNGGLK